MSDDGPQMLATFEFVLNTYKTAGRMLLSADPVLSDRQLALYAWASVWPKRTSHLPQVDWMPPAVFRQYHRPAHKDCEVVTLACVFYAQDDRRLITEPLCIGSKMYAATVETNDPYWWALVQRWALPAAPADGVVRVLGSEAIAFSGAEQQRFEQGVAGAKLATLAVPLLEIRSTTDLERRIIDPLLAFPFDRPPVLGPHLASPAASVTQSPGAGPTHDVDAK